MTEGTSNPITDMINNPIHAAALMFHATGAISPILYPYFDQDGTWIGAPPDRHTDDHGTLECMKAARLPAAVRVKRDRIGTHLLTSYVWRSGANNIIRHCEVAGNVILAEKKARITAPNLRTVGGTLTVKSGFPVHMPHLRSVGGNLDTWETVKFRAPRLQTVGGDLRVYHYAPPSLTTVGGRIWLLWTPDAVLPRLSHAGGSVVPHLCERFEAPVLVTVGGDLSCGDHAKEVLVPRLESVGGDFSAARAAIISANCLRTVGGSIHSQSAKQFFRSDVVIGGTWFANPEARTRHRAIQAINTDPFQI